MKQYKWNIRLTLLFGILVGLFLGAIFVYKVEINTINQALDSLDYCYQEYALKEPCYQEYALKELGWHNWVVSGENVSIYFDGQEFVKLDSEKSFSWWMQSTSEVRKVGIWNKIIYDGSQDWIDLGDKNGNKKI